MSDQNFNSASQFSFPVAGIATSSGGLNPLLEIVKKIPENSGITYIIIQDISPTKENLPQLLSAVTTIPVQEIISEVRLRPNGIFVLPPKTNLEVINGVLKLESRRRGSSLKTFDHFLNPLPMCAAVQQ